MEWPEIARRQAGVVSRRQLRGCGIDDRRISRLVARGALERVHDATFLARGAPRTYESRRWIAVLAVDGVLGFASAAHLHGFDDPPGLIHVIRTDLDNIAKPDGVRLHRVVVPEDAITRVNGLPVTDATWSLLDHIGRLRRGDAIRLADRAFQRGWLEPSHIEDRLQRFKGKQGNGMLRTILEHSADQAAAESERRLHALLRRAGVTGWTPKFRIVAEGRLVAVADVAIEDLRLAIEVDGWAFHSDVDRFQRDRTRQNALVALGWTILRFTWADLIERPHYVRQAITNRIVALEGRQVSM